MSNTNKCCQGDATPSQTCVTPDEFMVRPGQIAPKFTAQAYVQGDYRQISLEEHLGRWVILFFYPGDFTFVCPTELAQLATRQVDWNALDTQILTVSTDSQFVHKMWDEVELSKMVKGGIPFPMVADPNGQIGNSYGVYQQETGVHLRGRFIIDPDGIIQSMEVLNMAVARGTNELIRQIRAFRRVHEANEYTPADWTPDQPGLDKDKVKAGQMWNIWKPENQM